MTNTQEKIIIAATRLFLEEGIDVSTAKIAKAAGVSNGSLFNAFASKQILIDAIYIEAKTAMFASIKHAGDAPFNRKLLLENWRGYLSWAKGNKALRQVMHLLLESGLASDEAKKHVENIAAPHGVWIKQALDKGIIRGPSVQFIGKLIHYQLDLVITEKLSKEKEKLAFDMLCNAIGLSK